MTLAPLRTIFGNSIRMRLMRMSLLLSFTLLLISSIFLSYQFLSSQADAMRRTLESMSTIVRTNVAPTLRFADAREARRVLEALAADPNVHSAHIYDKDGKPFASYSRDGEERSYDERMQLIEDIVDNGERLGRIRIQFTDARLNDLYRRGLVALLVNLMIGAGISFAMAGYMRRYFSDPIVALAAAVQQVTASGDPAVRVPEPGPQLSSEELSSLAKEFNRLLKLSQARGEEAIGAKEAAEKANHLKSIFLANVSHELRTPLHGILSFARFGLDRTRGEESAEIHSFFEEIRESGTRLMHLLNDLLDLSKMEAGKMDYNMDQNDFVGLCHQVLAETRAYQAEKNVRLELDAPLPEIWITCDPLRITQVLTNLASNALKFSNPGSVARIVVQPREEQLQCTIVNVGIGIPEAELASVFDKFVQSSVTRTGAGGTGLGLSICREIIQHHKGRIWAESDPGGTTRFNFLLPFTAADGLTPRHEESA